MGSDSFKSLYNTTLCAMKGQLFILTEGISFSSKLNGSVCAVSPVWVIKSREYFLSKLCPLSVAKYIHRDVLCGKGIFRKIPHFNFGWTLTVVSPATLIPENVVMRDVYD